MKDKAGILVISLDFELYWGMSDKVTRSEYGANILGVRQVVPRLLALFRERGIHATWATVGMLAFPDRRSLEAALPSMRPQYGDPSMSTYAHLATGTVGESEEDDPYHFGASLLREILEVPGQEVGSHTFSHLYALDMQEDIEAFKADLVAAREALSPYGCAPVSLVFPRNQAKEIYLAAAHQVGILTYRGNENHFLYKARVEERQSLWVRALRLLDHYINLSGHHTFTIVPGQPVNVPASRFLRPYNPRLSWCEPLRLRRIKAQMTHAAKHGEVFHLWWHPHNFGSNLEENMHFLGKLLNHYESLRETYGMESKTMGEAANQMTL